MFATVFTLKPFFKLHIFLIYAVNGILWIGAVGVVGGCWLRGFLRSRSGEILFGRLQHDTCRLSGRHWFGILVYVRAEHASCLLFLHFTCGVMGAHGSIDQEDGVNAVFVKCNCVQSYCNDT